MTDPTFGWNLFPHILDRSGTAIEAPVKRV